MKHETNNFCSTCRDFIINGFSDDIEDMGHHLEISDEISAFVNGRVIDAKAEHLHDVFLPCETCSTICDVLYPITFNEMQPA